MHLHGQEPAAKPSDGPMSAMNDRLPKAPPTRGLSAKILALTVLCLLIGEVMIFVPSIARFRQIYLEERIAQAHLATLVPASSDAPIDAALEKAMLAHSGAHAITVISDEPELMLGAMIKADLAIDLDKSDSLTLIVDAFDTLTSGKDRVIAVKGSPPQTADRQIEVVMDETPMRMAMFDYAVRIFILSLILSAIVAGLIFFALQSLIVRPLGRLTEQIARFRAMPEDESRVARVTSRRDEIGIVARETGRMQRDLRLALHQKTRLAGLGEAVGKLNHDLRNILSTAILISDRLEHSADPAVQSASPRLTIALERALKLCAATLDYAKDRPAPLEMEPVAMARLIDNVAGDLALPARGIDVVNAIPIDDRVVADRDEIHRVILNLARNAADAMVDGGKLVFEAHRPARAGGYVIDVTDTGGGLPQANLARLFEPFAASDKHGGSGLGLAIAREIMRRHGGDLALVATGADGTHFRIVFEAHRQTATALEEGAL